MPYRLAFSDSARAGRNALPPADRKTVDAKATAVACDPYRCGSNAVLGNRDRRDAPIGRIAIVRYEVSSSVVTVTVVRVSGL
ncbi:hypothetical protein ACFWPV_15555 [Streptomyces uncialis]|uniref:hypothetical protein n=1 Tax=Streptomyces uncialis TaxID=1048205 RepID=UPI0036591A4B